MSDIPKSLRQRFVRRTWRRTSEKICRVNELPIGFRIVLLDEDGRVKRDDLRLYSGDFGLYPAGFPVSAFLDEVMKINVRNADQLDYASVQLRTHRDEPVDAATTLRKVRDMPGAAGARAVQRSILASGKGESGTQHIP